MSAPAGTDGAMTTETDARIAGNAWRAAHAEFVDATEGMRRAVLRDASAEVRWERHMKVSRAWGALARAESAFNAALCAATAPTPYDTGARLEPQPWVRDRMTSTGGLPRHAKPDDFGRVDFDDDESRTVLTLFVERTASGYAVHVETGDQVAVVVNGEPR